MKKFNLIGLQKFSKNIRRNILFAAKCGGSSSAHIGGALSCVDILSVLFLRQSLTIVNYYQLSN